jgi:predicted AlkP superfamily pyrophosphatase or phosphodiesterase
MIAVLLRALAFPVLSFLVLSAGAVHAAPLEKTAPERPKLVVVLVVDGLPQEQVQRYRHQFGQGGFRRLLEEGAWFSDAHHAHGITVTAAGHAAILTGAYPYQHGIIGNHWIDPASNREMYCTEDPRHRYLGDEVTQPDNGTSPANLRVTTLGDELRYATGSAAKVLAVSGKDRGAILLAGRTGTAYMYMDETGNFASSSWYMNEHPAWVREHQARRPQDRYFNTDWKALLPAAAYAGDVHDEHQRAKPDAPRALPFRFGAAGGKPDADYYNALRGSPFLDELTLEFARAAIVGENLGRNPAGVPDLLGVSLSAHDIINHGYGPESKMSHDHLQRLDRMLAGFFGFLDQRIGLDNVLVLLTADHGFANVPEFSTERKLDAGRLDFDRMVAALDLHLGGRFGVDKLVRNASIPHVLLDYGKIERRGLRRAEVEDAAARFLLGVPGVADVYTRTQLEQGVGATRLDLLMRRAWHRQVAGDLMVVVKPHWVYSSGSAGASHGTPYTYDTNVPLMIMGRRWIRPGAVSRYAEVVDIAPTLAHLLRVRPPAASEGRALTEILR